MNKEGSDTSQYQDKVIPKDDLKHLDKVATDTQLLMEHAGPSRWWLVFVAVPFFIIWFLIGYSDAVGSILPEVPVFGADPSVLRDEFAKLGDAVGGVFNPVLSFIGLIFLIYTLIQNQRALDQNAEELRLTRMELARASAAQEAQEETLRQQKAEDTFFNLLSVNMEILQEIRSKDVEYIEFFLVQFLCNEEPSYKAVATANHAFIYLNNLETILDFVSKNSSLEGYEKYIYSTFSLEVILVFLSLSSWYAKFSGQDLVRVMAQTGVFKVLSVGNLEDMERRGEGGAYHKKISEVIEMVSFDAFSDPDKVERYYQRCKRVCLNPAGD